MCHGPQTKCKNICWTKAEELSQARLCKSDGPQYSLLVSFDKHAKHARPPSEWSSYQQGHGSCMSCRLKCLPQRNPPYRMLGVCGWWHFTHQRVWSSLACWSPEFRMDLCLTTLMSLTWWAGQVLVKRVYAACLYAACWSALGYANSLALPSGTNWESHRNSIVNLTIRDTKVSLASVVVFSHSSHTATCPFEGSCRSKNLDNDWARPWLCACVGILQLSQSTLHGCLLLMIFNVQTKNFKGLSPLHIPRSIYHQSTSNVNKLASAAHVCGSRQLAHTTYPRTLVIWILWIENVFQRVTNKSRHQLLLLQDTLSFCCVGDKGSKKTFVRGMHSSVKTSLCDLERPAIQHMARGWEGRCLQFLEGMHIMEFPQQIMCSRSSPSFVSPETLKTLTVFVVLRLRLFATIQGWSAEDLLWSFTCHLLLFGPSLQSEV